MKLTVASSYMPAILLLAIICLIMVAFGTSDRILDTNISSAIDGVKLKSSLDAGLPLDESFISRFEAGLAPAPGYNFIASRVIVPVWGKTVAEYIPLLRIFFCPLMVIIIFLFFYQSSRNGAGLDHPIGFFGM